jgi:two-component system OmpR family response regulator
MNAASADSRGEGTSTMVDNSDRSIVLIVDDDPWIRLLLHDLLTDEGYAVEEASNGSTALRLAQRHPPALVLLDLVLPEQSGLALLTELKSTSATAHVPVIAVTARTDLLVRAAELADAIVAKPFDIEELLAKISAVLAAVKSAAPCDEVHRLQRGPARTAPTTRRIPGAGHFGAV